MGRAKEYAKVVLLILGFILLIFGSAWLSWTGYKAGGCIGFITEHK